MPGGVTVDVAFIVFGALLALVIEVYALHFARPPIRPSFFPPSVGPNFPPQWAGYNCAVLFTMLKPVPEAFPALARDTLA